MNIVGTTLSIITSLLTTCCSDSTKKLVINKNVKQQIDLRSIGSVLFGTMYKLIQFLLLLGGLLSYILQIKDLRYPLIKHVFTGTAGRAKNLPDRCRAPRPGASNPKPRKGDGFPYG